MRNLGAQIENGILKAGAPRVLGPNLIIDHNGKEVDTQTSEYICIPSNNPILRPIPITMQLGTKGLKELITAMRVLLKHNFCCGVLCIVAGLKLLHYNTLLSKRGYWHFQGETMIKTGAIQRISRKINRKVIAHRLTMD